MYLDCYKDFEKTASFLHDEKYYLVSVPISNEKKTGQNADVNTKNQKTFRTANLPDKVTDEDVSKASKSGYTITLDDREQIHLLTMQKVPKDKAIQAFLDCGKDLIVAANLLYKDKLFSYEIVKSLKKLAITK